MQDGVFLDTATAVEQLDLAAAPPDVLVLDLYLGRDDVPTTPWIPRLVAWGAPVLLCTSSEFPVPVRQAVAAGASGLVLKSDPFDALLAGAGDDDRIRGALRYCGTSTGRWTGERFQPQNLNYDRGS